MDKNDLERRLEAAEKQNIGLLDEIKNLKAQLAEMQDEEIPEFPTFKGSETYFFCDAKLDVRRTAFPASRTNHVSMDYNAFHTAEYAQLFADKCREIAMLLHCKWHLEEKYRSECGEAPIKGYDIVELSKTVDKNGNLGDYKYTAGNCYLGAGTPFVTFANCEDAQKAAEWLNAHWKEDGNG